MALFGGVEGEQLDPCYHEACDNIGTVTGQPPAETMNVYEADPTPANLAIAQEQANSLQGNALKSLREMSGAVTHAVWFFGQNRRRVGSRTTADRQRATAARLAVQVPRPPADPLGTTVYHPRRPPPGGRRAAGALTLRSRKPILTVSGCLPR